MWPITPVDPRLAHRQRINPNLKSYPINRNPKGA